MKHVKFFVSVFAALLLFAAPAFAMNADGKTNDYGEELKKSSGVILQSLLSFSREKAFTMDGETKNVTETSFLGETETDEQISKITGMYQMPDKMYMKSESESEVNEVVLNENGYYVRLGGEGKWEHILDKTALDLSEAEGTGALENIDITALLLEQTKDIQGIIKDIKIVNVFEENGVKYIDISAGDFDGMLEEIKSGLKDLLTGLLQEEEAAGGEEDADGLQELLDSMYTTMIDSMEISMNGYFRINTNAKKVEGMGFDIKISMEVEIFSLPLSVVSNSVTFIKTEGIDKAIELPSVE